MPHKHNDQPRFVFISYSHKDHTIVLPIIQAMKSKGVQLWYDQSIEAGQKWADTIADHLQKCSVFLSFTSRNSVTSENCLDEIAYAKSYQKPSIMVFIEENVVLPSGTEMQTSRFQRSFFTSCKSTNSFVDLLCETSLIRSCVYENSAVHSTSAQIPENKSEYNLLYDVTCSCGNIISFGKDILNAGSTKCKRCGELLDFDLDGLEEPEFESEDTYEVTCVCGNVITFGEKILNSGSIKCKQCGELLDFDLDGLEESESESEDTYEVTCVCGNVITFGTKILNSGSIKCKCCSELLIFDLDDLHEA